MNHEPQYLGDGVYAELATGSIKVFTHDGYSETNRIFLEPEVARALAIYIKRAFAKTKP